MILKVILGENWGGMDRYATRARGARMLALNFGGDTVAERIREAAALRSTRPNLKRVIGQIILGHDKALTDLTDEQWLIAIEIAKKEHDLRDAAFCAVLHVEKHVHLYYVRVRPDSSVVSDSHSYRKNEAAARRIEQELGLPAPIPVSPKQKVGDRRKSDNATRRGRRKQLTEGENFMETAELSRRIFLSVASSSNADEFHRELAARGIEAEWTSNLAGLKLRPVGSSTWLKASSVSRAMSGAKIIAELQKNADSRHTAEQTSIATVTAVATNAMPPSEVKAARPLADAGPDPLSFLVSKETALPMLDDMPVVVGAGAFADEDEDAARRREHALAVEALAVELRKMSAQQLIELRNAAKRPLDESVILLALLEKLLALVLRILSFSALKKATPVANLLAQRQAIADAADDEIARRHRSPATASQRMRSLAEHESALKARKLALDAHQTIHALAKLRAPSDTADLRKRATSMFDAAQVNDGKPTTAALKSELREYDSVISALQAQSPSAFAKLRRAAAVREWEWKFSRATELRAIAAARLQEFFDLIERVIAATQVAKSARRAEENAVLADEAAALKIEIRDRVPFLLADIGRDTLRERLRQIGDNDAPYSTPDTPRIRG